MRLSEAMMLGEIGWPRNDGSLGLVLMAKRIAGVP